jgi:hypothetical protein
MGQRRSWVEPNRLMSTTRERLLTASSLADVVGDT